VKTILLVDSDLGFAFWLGHALDQAGYDALPARSAADGLSLVRELNVTVDLVVVRASLPSAATLVGDLRKAFGSQVKVIAIVDEETAAEVRPWADVESLRPRVADENSRMALVHTVRMVMMEGTLRSC
jgi:DNA-binding response OmpR family regulator